MVVVLIFVKNATLLYRKIACKEKICLQTVTFGKKLKKLQNFYENLYFPTLYSYKLNLKALYIKQLTTLCL